VCKCDDSGQRVGMSALAGRDWYSHGFTHAYETWRWCSISPLQGPWGLHTQKLQEQEVG
jgi:hypothetical protein